MHSEEHDNNLLALHRVLTRARTQAYLGMSPRDIGRLLDDTEYLAALLLQDGSDNDAEFRELLLEMERKYPGFEGLTAPLTSPVALTK